MRILALDLGKYKTVACDYEAENGRHRFAMVLTTPKALHDLIVDREPDRVVIEICSIAGWVCDLVRTLGIELQVANTNDERWHWRKVKTKNDRNPGACKSVLLLNNCEPKVIAEVRTRGKRSGSAQAESTTRQLRSG